MNIKNSFETFAIGAILSFKSCNFVNYVYFLKLILQKLVLTKKAKQTGLKWHFF